MPAPASRLPRPLQQPRLSRCSRRAWRSIISARRRAIDLPPIPAFRCLVKEHRAMIAVIFEVLPKEEYRQEYLDIAASLRPLLDDIDGFISIERFQSLT